MAGPTDKRLTTNILLTNIDDVERQQRMAADTDFDDDAFAETGFSSGGGSSSSSSSSSGGGTSGGSAAVAKDKDEGADARTVAGRQKVREKLAKDVEAFLARGGSIQEVDANTTADPPVRPTSEYGSRPI